MGAVQTRIPEEEAAPVRATGYVRALAQDNPHSAKKQKAAILRYAQDHKLHISSICSETHQLRSR